MDAHPRLLPSPKLTQCWHLSFVLASASAVISSSPGAVLQLDERGCSIITCKRASLPSPNKSLRLILEVKKLFQQLCCRCCSSHSSLHRAVQMVTGLPYLSSIELAAAKVSVRRLHAQRAYLQYIVDANCHGQRHSTKRLLEPL